MSEFNSAMAGVLRRMLGHSIRAEGHLALMMENCKGCSAYVDYHQPLKRELDAVVTVVNHLIEVFVKEVEQ